MRHMCLIATTVTVLLGLGMTARADQVNDVIQTLLKAQNTDVMCRKADVKRRIFSLRSFEGRLCKIDYIAAFAELACAGVADYPSSGCAKEARKALRGRDPQQVLQDAVGKHVGRAKDFVCDSVHKTNKARLQALAAAAKC